MSITINHQTNDLSIAGGGAPTLGGAAAGGGSWSLISTQTVSSAVATVDFTSIGSYNRYVLNWDVIMAPSSNLAKIKFYDNGTLLSSSNYTYLRSKLSSFASFTTTSTGFYGTSGLITSMGSFEVCPALARWPSFMTTVGFTGTNNTAETMFTTGGLSSTYSETSLTGLQFTTTANTAVISSGRISLYGISQ